MFHITRTKSKKFQVVLVGKNGEPLSTSELFPKRITAFKNVDAQLNTIEHKYTGVFIQDDTTKKPTLWLFADGKRQSTDHYPFPKYIPGKNPKKKK